MMLLFILLPAFCLAVTAAAQANDTQLWGYGKGIEGLPLFYSDGMLFLLIAIIR